jgi:hypothetical protein
VINRVTTSQRGIRIYCEVSILPNEMEAAQRLFNRLASLKFLGKFTIEVRFIQKR